DNLAHREQVSNRANIIFDYNEPILTNTWTNTLDIARPHSSVSVTQLTDSTLNVAWSGNDAESGVNYYKLYAAVNDGAFLPLGNYFSNEQFVQGYTDTLYSFYVEAVDKTGNAEMKPSAAEASIRLVKTEPAFIAVTGITNVPSSMTAGGSLTLAGTVAPDNATNKTIVWSIKNAGTTGATLSGNTLSAKVAGTVTVTATVANGATETTDYTQDFTVTVSSTPVINAETPAISTQPQDATVDAGSNVTLSVSASVGDGGTLSFQWYSSTSNVNTDGTSISGATAGSYSPATTTPGTTWYYVVITNTNSSVNGTQTASATSHAASVTVNAPVVSPTTYAITVAPSANGQVTATPSSAAAGATVTLTVTPAANHVLSTITAHRTGTESATVALAGTGNTRTFTMPSHDVTVRATFTPATGTEALPQAKVLSARTQNGQLHVSGLTAGQPWSVYSISGTLIHHSTAAGDKANISLPSRGIYIVRSGNRSIKAAY
ncbi:MAG: hypothetical protein LBL33_06425, partial [Tannerella sp.]|nr:hypothetical protein [Tannerella sp.]